MPGEHNESLQDFTGRDYGSTHQCLTVVFIEAISSTADIGGVVLDADCAPFWKTQLRNWNCKSKNSANSFSMFEIKLTTVNILGPLRTNLSN